VVDLIDDLPQLVVAAGMTGTSGWCGNEVRSSGGAVGVSVSGLVLALIETEGRIFVSHQGHIGDDAVEPAVEAQDEIEEPLGVRLGE
jgi:hypothetical protein